MNALAPSARAERTRRLLVWIVFALVAGPIGTAVFVLGFGHRESPCILCWAQRTGMVLIALTGLFILRYGPRPRYVGFAMLLAVHGMYMGLRHSALHLARDVGQGFSTEILGAHTNTWSLLIFWVAALVMAILLIAMPDGQITRSERRLTRFESMVAWLFLTVVAGNAVQAFASTGPPPYVGQSDPVRFSFDPRHWVWSLEEWAPVPLGLRGRWAIPRPATDGLPTDPAAGPLGGITMLEGARRAGRVPGDEPVTGLAFDPGSDRFLVATRHGVVLTDASFSRALGRVVVDPAYSVDLARFGDAAFLDSHTVMAVSENKSYVILRENERADPDATYRFFLVPGPFEEVTRGRFATVRARLTFVRAAAVDSVRGAVYTLNLPNPRSPRLVVSRFDRGDLTLSQEFLPSLDAASGLHLLEGRSLDELYFTGATMHDGHLLGVSAVFGLIVQIDVERGRVTGALGVPGLRQPAGIAVRGTDVYVSTEDGTIMAAPLTKR